MRKPSPPADAGTHVFSAPAFAGASIPPGAHLPFIYLPIAAVCSAVGFSVSRVYTLIAAGEFPPGDLIGAQSRRWKSTDIAAWLLRQAEKAAAREDELAGALKRKANKAAAKSVAERKAAKEADHAPA